MTMMHSVATRPRAWTPRNQSSSQKKSMTTGSTILSPKNMWLNPSPRRHLLSIPNRVPILSQSSRRGSLAASSTVHPKELGLLVLGGRCLSWRGGETNQTWTLEPLKYIPITSIRCPHMYNCLIVHLSEGTNAAAGRARLSHPGLLLWECRLPDTGAQMTNLQPPVGL